MDSRPKMSAMDQLFGPSDSKIDEDSPTKNYQERRNNLLREGNLLATAFWVALVWGVSRESIPMGIALAFGITFLKVHSLLSIASDALFDSLWERVNLQSARLDVRLRMIDRRIESLNPKAPTGEKVWAERYAGELDLSEAWRWYPEMKSSSPFGADLP